MATQVQHTLKAFDDDIDRLRGLIDEIGKLALTAIEQSMTALQEGDTKLARKVVKRDKTIDGLEQKIDGLAIRTIALRAPMADDLRDIVAALKIGAVIERIGDYAKNVAKRVPKLEKRDEESIAEIVRMGHLAADLVAMALTAFAERDEKLAIEVAERDDVVDDLYSQIFKSTLEAMASGKKRNVSDEAHLLFVAKHLERIGDHATNIAEVVHYAATGEAIPEPAEPAA